MCNPQSLINTGPFLRERINLAVCIPEIPAGYFPDYSSSADGQTTPHLVPSPSLRLIREGGHKLKLKKVSLVLAVNESLRFLILAYTCSDVFIKHRIGEA